MIVRMNCYPIDAVISETRNYDKDQHTGGDVKVRFTGDGTWDGTRSDLTYDSRELNL